jgi:hypothetical protein
MLLGLRGGWVGASGGNLVVIFEFSSVETTRIILIFYKMQLKPRTDEGIILKRIIFL